MSFQGKATLVSLRKLVLSEQSSSSDLKTFEGYKFLN
jgi:hypothetical protein